MLFKKILCILQKCFKFAPAITARVRENEPNSTVHINHAKIAQLVERNLAKVEVAGSNPVFRSNTQAPACVFFLPVREQLEWWNW